MTVKKNKTSQSVPLDGDQVGFGLLFENHPTPMWVYDLETLAFLDVNDAAVKKYGYTREEFMGMTLKDIRPPEDVPRLIEDVARARPSWQSAGEWRHALKNGRVIDVEITSHILEFNGRQAALVTAQDITERKWAERALRESEFLYRDLVENSQNLICTHDLRGNLLSVNDSAVKLTGYPRDVLLKMNMRDALTPESQRRFDRYLANIKKRGKAHGELEVVIANGDVRIWEFHNTLRSEGLEEPIVRGMAHDITEQKQARNALNASEKRFRALIEHGLDNISLLAVDGTLLWESPSVTSTLGYAPNQFVGRNIFDLMHPDDMEWTRELYRQVLSQAGNSQRGSFRLRNSSGGWRWVEAIATNMLHEADIEAVVINYRDVTDRKSAEDALNQSEELFRNAFEHSAIGMALLSLDGKWLKVNSRICSTLGYSEKELLERTFQDITHPDDLDADLQYVKQILAGEIETYTMEKRYIHKNGGIVWALLAVALVKDNSGTPLYFISQIKDISERKRMEDELYKSEQRYHALFENTPIAVFEEDFSEAKRYLDSLKQQGIKDFHTYFASNPEAVSECMALMRILDVNQAALDMYHAESKNDLIKSIYEGPSEGEQGYNHEDLIAIAEGKTSNSWEGGDETFTGKPLEISLSWSVAAGYEDDFSKVIVTTVDITENKQAEEKLKKSEERYRAIAEDMPVMVCRFKPDGTLTFINSFYCEYFGMSHDELLGSNLLALVPGPERDTIREKYLSLNREKPFITYEYKTTKPNGEECWQKWTDRALFNEKGEIVEYQSIGEDVTERKQAEEKVRRDEEILRLFVEHSPASIAMLDRDMKYIVSSRRYLKDYRLGEQSIVGQSHYEVFPEIPERWKEIHWRCLAGAVESSDEDSFQRVDGGVDWVRWEIRPWHESDGQIGGIIIFSENITERKQAEEERKRLIHDLGERVKEVTFLHNASKIFMDYSRSEDEVMRDVVAAMPGAWQYPEITAARIGFNGQQFATPNFKETDWMQNQFFELPGGDLGMIQVAYLEEKPEADEGPFLKEERNLLDSMAEKIRAYLKGISADRAINRQLTELEALYESGLAISHLLTPREIAHEVIGVLDRKLKWHHIAVRQYDRESNRVELIGFHRPGVSEKEAETFIVKMNQIISTPAQGLSGWVTLNGKSVRVPNVKIDSRYTMTFPEIHSGIYVPLKVGGRVIGSISVESEKENAFTEHDERLLETLAGQAAIAIENANLFHELQAELTERQMVEDEVRQLNAELEQRVQERTLQIEATKRRLELATHAGQIGVWEYNPRENKVVWDERMHMIHRVPLGRFDETAEGWAKFVHPDDLKKSQVNTQLAMTQNLLSNNEHRILLPDGTIRHIATSAVTVFAEDGTPDRVIGISMDITERKQIEDALKLANAELETAMQVKDEFLANMSHELRTPLNAILGISESLEEQIVGALNDKQLKYTRIIKESGRHLLDLINDILDISKIEAGRMELDFHPISVEKLCQSSLRMVKELAQKKSLNVSLNIKGNASVILGDERRLKQALVNLLGNAVKFTESGRQIGLEVNGYPERNEVSFTVWDQGIGITQENLQYLFKPFVQLDAGLEREFQGTGLGLALVAQMIRLHGGHVSVESELGAGSRFTITLPWQADEQTARAKGTGQLPPSNHTSREKRKGRILIVEDTDVIINLMNEYLTHKGYQVLVASNGREGIQMAKSERPDLILMDVMMPIMDGLEATKAIRADTNLRNIPIIALTALAMPGDRERCLAAGMTDYMSKPVKMDELAQVIERYIVQASQAANAK